MVITVCFLCFSLVFPFLNWGQMRIQIVSLQQQSLAETNFNKNRVLEARLIEDTSILEVTLHNKTKKSIVFVESFSLRDIEIEIRDKNGRLVEEPQPKQSDSEGKNIIKVNEGSWQIVTVLAGEDKIIKKIDIKKKFGLSSGIYNVVVKKRVWFEGEKEYQIVKSNPLKIKI